ncbi:MAG: hypothetical protein RLP44_21130 [Aggregatilineales bacterium]
MLQNQEHQLTLFYSDSALNQLYDVLDQLHNAASEGRTQMISRMSTDDLKGVLQDIIYTAQETLSEIESQSERPAPQLRLLEKPSA